MFGKKCIRCGRKKSTDFEFCPYCGNDFRVEKRAAKEKNYGFLGKDDFVDSFRAPLNINSLFNSKLFDSGLFNSLFKQVEKQIRDIDQDMKMPKEKMKDMSGISISISMDQGKKPDIRINRLGNMQEILKEKKIPKQKLSDEKAKKLAKLPKKEAKTEVRRLSNKIIYELEFPGVRSLKDVVINKLENSIEIKAFAKDTVYFKLLPLNLPILNYKLKDEKLILELKPN